MPASSGFSPPTPPPHPASFSLLHVYAHTRRCIRAVGRAHILSLSLSHAFFFFVHARALPNTHARYPRAPSPGCRREVTRGHCGVTFAKSTRSCMGAVLQEEGIILLGDGGVEGGMGLR